MNDKVNGSELALFAQARDAQEARESNCYPACPTVTKNDLLEVRASILDALALLKTLKRGPDGGHGNGGHDRERVEKTAQRVTERLQAAAEVLHAAITGEGEGRNPTVVPARSGRPWRRTASGYFRRSLSRRPAAPACQVSSW